MNAPDAKLSVIERILELARWAPSGDNEQPWLFQIVDERRLVIYGRDTRDRCVYDLDGSATQIALGALIENITIAAAREGLRADAVRRAESPIDRPCFDVAFERDDRLGVDPLVDSIERRSVQRRALKTRSLTAAERLALEAALGNGHNVVWIEGPHGRRRMASLLFASAKLRLVMPEAYLVHRDAIEWGARYSEDRVPEEAVGLDAATARLMRWVMKSWKRVEFFNRFLAGTWMPRLQLDVVPALACAAHFVIVANKPAIEIDDFVAAGRAMQRFWLTATQLGLQLQPELTPLIFARYSRNRVKFSELEGMSESAHRLAVRLAKELGDSNAANAVFMGRVGAGAAATARSLRKPLASLMVESEAADDRRSSFTTAC